MSSLFLLVLTLVALGLSFARDRARTREALRRSLRSFLALLPGLLATILLLGLVLALLPPGALAGLFRNHGAFGFLVVTLVGSLVTVPAPVAYPLAGALLRQGVSLSALAAFITTLTMVGVITAPMEIAHFGRRFTLIRQGLSLVLAVAIGLLMGRFL